MEEEQCLVIVENAWRLSMGMSRGVHDPVARNVAHDFADWSRNIYSW